MEEILREHGGKSWQDILATLPQSQLYIGHDPLQLVTRLDSANLFRFGTHPMKCGPRMILCQHCKEVVMRDACVDQHCLLCAGLLFGKEGVRKRAAKSVLIRDALMTPNLESVVDIPPPASSSEDLKAPSPRSTPSADLSFGNGSNDHSIDGLSSAQLRRSSRISHTGK